MENTMIKHVEANDSDDELPLDLNPSTRTTSAIISALCQQRLHFSKGIYHGSVPSVEAASGRVNYCNKPMPKSFVSPRPLPPVPSQFFVHMGHSWRSMPKDVVRMHIVHRFAARDKYFEAYRAWEADHDNWAYEVYGLMRTVMKAQDRVIARQQTDQMDIESANEPDFDEDTEIQTVLDELTSAASQAATDFEVGNLQTLDLNGTALTELQDGAEVDDQERLRRWFISNTKRMEQARTIPRKILPLPYRAGPSTMFGLSYERTRLAGESPPRKRKTPSFVLPNWAARNVLISNSQAQASPLHPATFESRKDQAVNEGDGLSHPQRIYSTKCSCGYVGCHCQMWRSWWDETQEMIGYVEHVDIPVHSASGTLSRFVRICPGIEPSNVEQAISNSTSERSTAGQGSQVGKDWAYDRFASETQAEVSSRVPAEASEYQYLQPIPIGETKYLDPKSDYTPKETQSALNTPAENYETIQGKTDHTYIESTPDLVEDTGGKVASSTTTDNTVACEPSQTSREFKLQWEQFVEIDPKMSNEYSSQIFKTLMDLEPASLPIQTPQNKRSMRWSLRPESVDWIAHVHYRCSLSPQTLFLAVNLLDRCLFKQPYNLDSPRWQKLAAACLWSAWKYEGDGSQSVPLDAIISHMPFKPSREDMISIEWYIHVTVDHDLSFPGPLVFMRRILTTFKCTKDIAYLARFLVEISLMSRNLALHPPSATAAAAVWLARELMGVPGWTAELEDATTWSAHDLLSPVKYIISTVRSIPRDNQGYKNYLIFMKWTHPSVNDLARWCQDIFWRAWSEATLGHLHVALFRLGEIIRSGEAPPLKKIDPGPLSGSALFEV